MRARRCSKPAILFDLDGTLVDTVYEHVMAWFSALQSMGIVAPNWKIHHRIGMNGRSLVEQLVREEVPGKRTVNGKALEAKHDAAFKKLTDKIRPLPGTRELLNHLGQSGICWAIATTGNRVQTERVLKALKIAKGADCCHRRRCSES
jgi:beta-phosphoglucomutase-like phosphatase (HAD superfamily)